MIPAYAPSHQDWQRQVSSQINPLFARWGVYRSASEFGVAGDNTTDDSVALTQFINSVNANPGKPHFLDNLGYATSILLPQITTPGAWIVGTPGNYHDVGSLLTGSTIKYIGSANSGAILSAAPIQGSSNQFLTGVQIQGVNFDCNSLAGIGFQGQSLHDCRLDLGGANSTNHLFDFGVVATLGEAADFSENIVRLKGRQIEANGIGLYLSGSATANVSMNEFHCDFQHRNAPAVVCANSDNNQWKHLRATFATGGTATESVQLLGGANVGVCARDEQFYHLSVAKPLRVYGTSDGYAAASYGHRLVAADWDNGTPSPVLGTGAWIDCELPQSYTPVITGTGGTGLATASVSASYVRQFAFIDVAIAFQMTAGTGYSALSITLPFANAGTIGVVSVSKERASTGKLFSGYIDGSASSIGIQSADGSTALPTGTYNITARYRVR